MSKDIPSTPEGDLGSQSKQEDKQTTTRDPLDITRSSVEKTYKLSQGERITLEVDEWAEVIFDEKDRVLNIYLNRKNAQVPFCSFFVKEGKLWISNGSVEEPVLLGNHVIGREAEFGYLINSAKYVSAKHVNVRVENPVRAGDPEGGVFQVIVLALKTKNGTELQLSRRA